MSRLKRNIARRDKAGALFEQSQEKQLLHVEPKLVRLLQDIPASAFTPTSKPEWQTLVYVAQVAAVCGLTTVSVDTVADVMPANLQQFKDAWAVARKAPGGVHGFLNVLQYNSV